MTLTRRGIKLVTRWEVEGGQRRQITTTGALSYLDSPHLEEHWRRRPETATEAVIQERDEHRPIKWDGTIADGGTHWTDHHIDIDPES